MRGPGAEDEQPDLEQPDRRGPAVGAVVHHLRLKRAFGSGVRDAEHVARLAEPADLTVRTCRDIGWDHRLWVITPARD
ncbi:hypothetical protein GTY54_38680 [Streptomyces sp. SID625]|nr:hypothetical protein [Streptomyces sp. SID625]